MTGLDVSIKDGVLTATLDRPERRNALDDALLAALEAAAHRAGESDIRVVVLAANGSAFCAGADLTVEGGHDGIPGPSEDTLLTSDRVFRAWEQIPVPVIASVQGAAFAGGLELVLCCDIVICANAARFADAHARFGLLPGAGGAYRLPRKVGASAASLLLFSGTEISAQEALRIGLADRLVPDDELAEQTGSLARHLASLSSLGLRETKRLISDAARLNHEDGLAAGRDAILRHRRSADYAEGLRAFAERRTPRFVGR